MGFSHGRILSCLLGYFSQLYPSLLHSFLSTVFPSAQPSPPLSLWGQLLCRRLWYCSFTASLLRIATSAYGSAAIWANTTGIHNEWRVKMMGTYCFNYSIQSVWECTNTVDLFRLSLSLWETAYCFWSAAFSTY